MKQWCPNTSAFTRFISHTAQLIFHEYIVCAVKSITKGSGTYLHWLEMQTFIIKRQLSKPRKQQQDLLTFRAQPFLLGILENITRSGFQTFIIEQCMMNHTSVFHLRPAWKRCQDLQWAAAFLCSAHTVYLTTKINLQHFPRRNTYSWQPVEHHGLSIYHLHSPIIQSMNSLYFGVFFTLEESSV